MYSYFYGKIISINKKSITIDVNNIGYVINTPLPEVFLKDEKMDFNSILDAIDNK